MSEYNKENPILLQPYVKELISEMVTEELLKEVLTKELKQRRFLITSNSLTDLIDDLFEEMVSMYDNGKLNKQEVIEAFDLLKARIQVFRQDYI